MIVQKFPLATLQKIRQYIQKSLMPADTEQPSYTAGLEEAVEIPEPTSLDTLSDLFSFGSAISTSKPVSEGRWLISTINPADALVKLPGLHLKPGYRLVSYLYRAKKNGTGVVWAVPETCSTTAHLERAIHRRIDPDQPPHPAEALPDIMAAIEGDRSPASFMLASLLRRELREFGASGQRRNWSHHRLVNTVPPQLIQQQGVDQLKELASRVQMLSDNRAAVEFFTCRVADPVAIFRHVDLYGAYDYTSNQLDRAVTGTRKPKT